MIPDFETARSRHNVARFFVENRHVSWVLFAAVLGWGIWAYQVMPKRKDPFRALTRPGRGDYALAGSKRGTGRTTGDQEDRGEDRAEHSGFRDQVDFPLRAIGGLWRGGRGDA